MDTKLKGDIAEVAATLYALNKGWGVLRPVGDRLPYDLCFDVQGVIVRVQVKSAWLYERTGMFLCETRRIKTNRRRMLCGRYGEDDFDFAAVYIDESDVFYVFPIEVFLSYKGQIAMAERKKRQRASRSAEYRDAWGLIEDWASSRRQQLKISGA